MNINDVFKGSYLKASDIQHRQPVTVTITDIELQKFDEGAKLCMTFNELDQGLVINLTNARIMAATYGDESNNWLGKQIKLIVDPHVMFNGNYVPAIRVRCNPADTAPVAPAAPVSETGSVDEDVPLW